MKKDNKEGMPEIAQKLSSKKPVLLLIGVVLIIILGRMLFSSHANEKVQKPVEEIYMPQVQPALEIKKNPSQSTDKVVKNDQNPQITKEMMQEQFVLLQERQKELQQRLSAPLMIVNNNSQGKTVDEKIHTVNQVSDSNVNSLGRFSNQKEESLNATKMGELSSTLAEGSLIHAILESASNSDLPGYLRATVSEASFSEDGTRVLVPPGSRLIGQYKSGMTQGQSRIFVVWTRLITPDGVSVNLESPGVDNLGVAGMGADEIDRHFWERVGTASLLSLISTGAANSNLADPNQDNPASMYRSALSNSFAQTAQQSLQQESTIAPTLKTYQGKPIIVFVAHDIHFESVIKQLTPKVKVF